MRIGSLFSGAGLLDAGLHQAGHEHAWFVEREPERRALLAKRWPGRPVHDDVRTVGAHNLERVDLIAGGFPCKGASNAGPRNGFDHPETALWAEFHRIVRELRPRYVAVENVAAIRGLHHGAVWGTVLGDLAALGYDVAWGCVRASDVGAPHGRDRVFAVARNAAHVGPERARAARLGRHEPASASPSVADTSSRLAQLRRGPGDVGGQAGGGGGEAWQQRDRDAAGDSREVAADVSEERRLAAVAAEQQPRVAANARTRDNIAVEWGDYEPAVRRWEAIHGPAPAPLTRVRRLDDGRAEVQRMRARMDRQRLSALGDGVHVYVGRLVGDALMELDHG